MNPCVISFASGVWYPRGQQRLLASLKDVGWSGGVRSYTSTSELSCPPHSESPYAFKPAAFNRAASEGFDVILWCDVAVWANQKIEPVFERIQKDGHMLLQGGWNCAQWTSDTCLKNMAVSRDEAEKMSHLMACCMGLDLRVERSREFLSRWSEYSRDGSSFFGGWSNANKTESQDQRCLGHRHDQSVASILSSQLGMEQIVGHPDYLMYYKGASNGGAFRYGEQNDMTQVAKNVCLLSQGM